MVGRDIHDTVTLRSKPKRRIISSRMVTVTSSTSQGMWTSPASRLLAKSVSERNPSLVRKEDIVIGALIERSNRFSVTF
jgi:hypothetical protein